MIVKLQYYGIYGKLKRRNKLWSSNKFDDDNLDDEADYSYLCGGNNILNYLCLSCLNHELNHKKGQIGIKLIIKIKMTLIIRVWGARGRWFESSHPDTIESIDNLMIVDAFCLEWLFKVHF